MVERTGSHAEASFAPEFCLRVSHFWVAGPNLRRSRRPKSELCTSAGRSLCAAGRYMRITSSPSSTRCAGTNTPRFRRGQLFTFGLKLLLVTCCDDRWSLRPISMCQMISPTAVLKTLIPLIDWTQHATAFRKNERSGT